MKTNLIIIFRLVIDMAMATLFGNIGIGILKLPVWILKQLCGKLLIIKNTLL